MTVTRIATGVTGLALILGAHAAHAQEIGKLIVDQLDAPPAAEVAVKAGKPILRVTLRSPHAVRLEEGLDLPPAVASQVAFNPAAPFRPGQVLTATEPASGRYCQPIRAQGLGLATACLVDADHDGRFEAVVKSGYNSASVHGMAISTKGEPVGVRYAKPVPLAAPIAYRQTGYQDGPAGYGTLRWVGRRPKTPGEPTQLGFIIDWVMAEGPYSLGIMVTYDGKPLRLDVYGVTIDVLGFDEKGALRIKVDSVRGGVAAPFLYRGRVMPIYITI